MKKIIAIDLAAIAGFALLVLYPDAIGGILMLGVALVFGYIGLSAMYVGRKEMATSLAWFYGGAIAGRIGRGEKIL